MTEIAATFEKPPVSSRSLVRVLLGGTVSVGSLAYLLWQVSWPQFDDAVKAIPFPSLVIAFAALALSVFLAAWRLIIIARYVGHKISLSAALSAVCLGQLASLFLFQIFGQLIVRGAILKRSGVPGATSVYLTLYERLTAIVLLLVLASIGAFSIFGSITIDFEAGGRDFVAIIVGGLFVLTSCILLAWGTQFRVAWSGVEPGFLLRAFLNAAVTVSIQLCTLVAFVVLASAIAPSVNVLQIAAASTIVMFAAAFPISMAGWGVRELGAVFALGAIGVPNSQALLVGIVIGVLSLLANLIMGVAGWCLLAQPQTMTPDSRRHGHPMVMLGLAVPILAAMAIFFQIHVPLAGNPTNVNFADPMALLGGGLFLLLALQNRPQWRLHHMNFFICLMSAAVVLSFVRGLYTIGWTQWAATRVFGWLIILGYGATGALIVRTAQNHGLKMVMRTLVSSVAAIVAFYLVCLLFKMNSIDPFNVPQRVPGFAVDANAFAFQLLVAIALLLGALRSWKFKGIMVVVLTIGVGLTGSRSGFIGFATMIAAYTIIERKLDIRVIAQVLLGIFIVVTIKLLLGAVSGLETQGINSLAFVEARSGSTNEHFNTVMAGLKIFAEHPFIGSGLGYFMATFWKSSAMYAHPIDSTAVSLLAETGILGFVSFLVPFTTLFLTEWKRTRSSKNSLAVSIVLLLAVFAAMSMFYDLLYQRLFWFILGVLIASRIGASGQANRALGSKTEFDLDSSEP